MITLHGNTKKVIFHNAMEDVSVLIKNWIENDHGIFVKECMIYDCTSGSIVHTDGSREHIDIEVIALNDLRTQLTIRGTRGGKLGCRGIYTVMDKDSRDAEYLRDMMVAAKTINENITNVEEV